MPCLKNVCPITVFLFLKHTKKLENICTQNKETIKLKKHGKMNSVECYRKSAVCHIFLILQHLCFVRYREK